MLVARESGGSVRDSLSLLDQVIASPDRRDPRREAGGRGAGGRRSRAARRAGQRAVLGKDAGAALALVDAAFTRGYDLAQLAHVVPRPPARPGGDRQPSRIRRRSSTPRPPSWRSCVRRPGAPARGLPELLFDRFAKIAEEVSKSPLPRYVLEVGLVELTRVEPLEPLSGLLPSWSELEARLEKGGGRRAAGAAPVRRPAPRWPGARAGGRGARVARPARRPTAAAARRRPQPRRRRTNFTELSRRSWRSSRCSPAGAGQAPVWAGRACACRSASEGVPAGQLREQLAQPARRAQEGHRGVIWRSRSSSAPIGARVRQPTESLLEVGAAQGRRRSRDGASARRSSTRRARCSTKSSAAPGRSRSSTTWRRKLDERSEPLPSRPCRAACSFNQWASRAERGEGSSEAVPRRSFPMVDGPISAR